MTADEPFVRRHPVLVYFTMTFAISWGGVILVIARHGGIPATKERLAAQLPVAILAMLRGPSISGLLLTGLVDGRAGLRDLLTRFTKWRVNLAWYAIALLTAPLVLMAVLLGLSLLSPVFLPGALAADNPVGRLTFGIVAGLAAGFCEELGWTGFAVPRLRLRYGVLTTGLVVGVLWGAWHIMGQVVMASRAYSGEFRLHAFLVLGTVGLLAGQLPAFRVLMVWVHDRTGSLAVVMLMHATYTAATLAFEPVTVSGVPLLVCGWVSTAALWVVVAVVAAADRVR